MNYICQLNGFRRWRRQHGLSASAQLLWFTLTLEQNDQHWPEQFGISMTDLRRMMGGIGVNTFRRAREQLVENGLVEVVVATHGNEVSQYRMAHLYGQPSDPSTHPSADPSADPSNVVQKSVERPVATALKPKTFPNPINNKLKGRRHEDGGVLGTGLEKIAGQTPAIRSRSSGTGNSRNNHDWSAEPDFEL